MWKLEHHQVKQRSPMKFLDILSNKNNGMRRRLYTNNNAIMATTSGSTAAEAYAAGVRDMKIAHYHELQNEIPVASHQISSLQARLRDLHVLLEADGRILAEVTRPLLKALEETSKNAQRVLTACGKHWENVWKPTERSASVAQDVFTIPELCEKILGYLPTNLDLHCAMRTNQAMAAVVRGSPSMQQKLGFAPAKNGHWYTAFDHHDFEFYDREHDDSFTCYMTGQKQLSTTVYAAFSFEESRPRLRGVMAAFRNAQICTPPIREMECHVDCCDHWQDLFVYGSGGRGYEFEGSLPPPQPLSPVKNPAGLTVGDLFKAMVRLKEEHTLCPYARESQIDVVSGHAQVYVSFKGQLALLPDDPVVVNMRKPATFADGFGWGVRSEHDLQIETQYKTRAEYAHARLDALRHGKPIPTLSEYTSRLAAERKEAWEDSVDETTDLLQSPVADDQAAEAPTWNEVSQTCW
ncbi:hypothetical protein LTR97_011524 [Elasticomyces elasticus]|uniref:Uncharacterized protein n=1 Tax=Elasticomyces elasticus TaxID=574655 RepID=A0AAN7W5H4_9PEZI|nr:hypothetical protein LTR97_011524 [Elasticomyces elasticus]